MIILLIICVSSKAYLCTSYITFKLWNLNSSLKTMIKLYNLVFLYWVLPFSYLVVNKRLQKKHEKKMFQ